jgi:hypothetical protein
VAPGADHVALLPPFQVGDVHPRAAPRQFAD